MVRKKKEYPLIQLILDLKKVSNINLFGIKQDKQPTIKKPISKKEKLKEFYRKHKKKIIGAGAVLGAAATYTVINKHYKNKLKQRREEWRKEQEEATKKYEEAERIKKEQEAERIKKEQEEEKIKKELLETEQKRGLAIIEEENAIAEARNQRLQKEKEKEIKVAEKFKATFQGNQARRDVEIIKKYGGIANINKMRIDSYELTKSHYIKSEECNKLKFSCEKSPNKKCENDVKKCLESERMLQDKIDKNKVVMDELKNIKSVDTYKYSRNTDVTDLKNDYEHYLSALYYTDYESGYVLQFNYFYFQIIFIIEKYYSFIYKNTETIVEQRFKIFLSLNKKDTCVITEDEINIYNYLNKNAYLEIDNLENFKNKISSCLKGGRKYILAMIKLTDYSANQHSRHRNAVIISPNEKKIWRLEPNFVLGSKNVWVIEQFKNDNLKEGVYHGINYYDYVNQVLHKYFNNNETPFIINGIKFTFGGYYSTSKNTCLHGGECKLISVLLSHLERDITLFDNKWYFYKYFEWEFNNIYKSKYDINKHTLKDLSIFINNKYNILRNMKFNNQEKLNNLNFNNLNEIKITNISVNIIRSQITELTFIKPTSNELEKQKSLSFGKRNLKNKVN
jgi:hypothetical protein